MNETTATTARPRRGDGMTPAEYVRDLSDADLDAIITGRTRVGATQTEQLAVWNAAITEEQDR